MRLASQLKQMPVKIFLSGKSKEKQKREKSANQTHLQWLFDAIAVSQYLFYTTQCYYKTRQQAYYSTQQETLLALCSIILYFITKVI